MQSCTAQTSEIKHPEPPEPPEPGAPSPSCATAIHAWLQTLSETAIPPRLEAAIAHRPLSPAPAQPSPLKRWRSSSASTRGTVKRPRLITGSTVAGSEASTLPSGKDSQYKRDEKLFRDISSYPYSTPADTTLTGAASHPGNYDRIMWHPDTTRLNALCDEYLGARKPLHAEEQARQVAIMERGGGLYDGEAVWFDEQTMLHEEEERMRMNTAPDEVSDWGSGV